VEYTKRHLRAAEDAVYSYETAIASDNPAEVFMEDRHWYGCGFCQTAPKGCEYCLLYDGREKWGEYPCERISDYNTVHNNYYISNEKYRAALKRRLKGLLRRMEKNGYIFVEKE
jgi:hypothetical protein